MYSKNPRYDLAAYPGDPRRRLRKNVRFETPVEDDDEYREFEDSDSDDQKFEDRDPRKRVDPIQHMLLIHRLNRISQSSKHTFLFMLVCFVFFFFILIGFFSLRSH
ncbi:Schizosaccharomyces specific protein [Schizosaccharomyces osmophilus]|uniref:Schizosaccharomyces specific protein n=1 Tax=Schizosaccharomyces osmophilus TaxID=2545709 RepID=A0AAF0AWT2_9SCHI|nr:Schizosaccharomyces specific protein [Schizosaccharomyces osmophilus]WBW73219.1 Schizosaccharomyces specific protein [Schizosaccharomyces osmophilus]